MSAKSRQRARDVRRAHRQGFTLSGYRFKEAGGPESLAERSRKGLQKQAQSEVKSNYAPLDSELNRREEKVKALDAKRAADEAVYRGWLTQQQGVVRSAAETANAKLQGMMADQKKALQERLRVAGEGARAAGILPEQQAGVAEANTIAQTGQTQGEANVGAIQGLANSQLAATQSNSLAYTAQQAAKRQADTLEQLAAVADDRTKTLLQRAADEQKRIGELLDGEVQKTQVRIASAQFQTKEQNDAAKEAQDAKDKAAARDVTTHGQDVSSADRAASRAQHDADKRAAFVEKHGITPEQWAGYSPKRKQRIIDQNLHGFGTKKSAGKDGGLAPRQERAAQSNLRDKVRKLKTAFRTGQFPAIDKDGNRPAPPIAPKTGKPARLTPGNGQIWSEWLQTNYGESAGLADMIIGYAIYGAKWKPSKRRRDAFNDYASTLPT